MNIANKIINMKRGENNNIYIYIYIYIEVVSYLK